MTDVRLAVGRGRAVVKGKFFALFGGGQRLTEHVVLFPKRDDLLFALGNFLIGICFFVHGFFLIRISAKNRADENAERFDPVCGG